MEKKQTSVLIVDDSKVACDLLAHLVEGDPALKVAGIVSDGIKALDWLTKNTADVISLDIFMPQGNGFEIAKRIMSSRPTPIVIVSAFYTVHDTAKSFLAMEAGALAIVEKPGGGTEKENQRKINIFLETLKIISKVKIEKSRLGKTPVRPTTTVQKPTRKISAIAIGASLGGPLALSTLLASLDPKLPVPVFIVQHIAPGFTAGFAEWLQSKCPLNISLAEHGIKTLPGNIYIAPDNCHMEIKPNGVISLDYKSTDLLRPSAAKLFHSMAEVYGPHGVGVILTGMGKDGAKELLLMHKKGAFTIAQDQNTSVVFGMPGEAVSLGAAELVLPLEQIGPTINDLLTQSNSMEK